MANEHMPLTSGSKQMWYIIGAIVIVVVLAWAVMRGGSTDSMSGNMDQQATSTDTMGTNTGGATGTGAGKLPAGWPADAPALQSGAKITYSGASNPKTKAVGPTVEYTAPGTAATGVAYFKSQFTQKGWTFRGQGDDLGSVMLAATKDTRRLSVSILETHPGTLSVTVQILK